MHAMKWLAFLGLFLSVAVLVATAQEEKTKKETFDAAKMVGTWTYVSGEKNGEKLDKDHFKDSKVIITRENITLEGDSGKFVLAYKLDTKKSPVGLSLKMTESPFGAGATANGIVAVTDYQLKICYAPEGDAPTSFAAKEGSKHHLFVLNRSPQKR